MLLVKRRRLNSKNCFSSSTLNSFTSIDTTCFRNRSIVSSFIFVVGISNADIQAMIFRFYSVPMEALVFLLISSRLASIWHLPFVSSQSMPWQRQRFSNLFVSELRNECWCFRRRFVYFCIYIGLSAELVFSLHFSVDNFAWVHYSPDGVASQTLHSFDLFVWAKNMRQVKCLFSNN